jgi:hypothetical protein
MWDWGSPIAWAVFLVGCGICAVLLGLGLKFVAVATGHLSQVQLPKRK